jgi:hypothetical protein
MPIATGRTASWEIVMRHVAQLPDCPEDLSALVLTDMRGRDAVGRSRYGTPLTSGNGRDHLIDAYQKCLDASVYLANELDEQGIGLSGHELEQGAGLSDCEVDWSKRKYLFNVWRLYSSQIRATIHLRSLIEERKRLVAVEEAK